MTTSELSDALNPNFYLRRPSHHVPNSPAAQDPQPPQIVTVPTTRPTNLNETTNAPQFTPHRSELEDAINPRVPTQTNPPQPALPKSTRQAPTEPLQFLKDILATFTAYRDTAEAEKHRRLAWEQDREAKYLQQQAETDERLLAMQREIDSLKAYISALPFQPNAALQFGQSAVIQRSPSQALAILPGNRSPINAPVNASMPMPSPSANERLYTTFSAFERSVSLVPEFVEGSSTAVVHDAPSREPSQMRRKRLRRDSSSDKDDLRVVIDQPAEMTQMKLRTRLDSRPQTIQTAMRYHVLRLMDLEHDKELPDSHLGDAPLPENSPVRFVWDKTTKRSIHNARMKTRIVSDMIANKELYPLVPSQEFTKPLLDPVFEQAFTTLRQKFKSQRDGLASSRARERDDLRSRRARRASRKKLKLAKRVSVRKEFREFTLEVFDGAFQLECMSSEESSEEEDLDDGSSDDEKEPRQTFLRIRYLSWRSSRLHKLFQVLDEREELDRSQKPKRGIGRKDRRMGLPKDGNPLPPKGVSRWMISKKWMKECGKHARIVEIVEEAIEEDEVDWSQLRTLGAESEEEELEEMEEREPRNASTTQYETPYFTGWPDGPGYIEQVSDAII